MSIVGNWIKPPPNVSVITVCLSLSLAPSDLPSVKSMSFWSFLRHFCHFHYTRESTHQDDAICKYGSKFDLQDDGYNAIHDAGSYSVASDDYRKRMKIETCASAMTKKC